MVEKFKQILTSVMPIDRVLPQLSSVRKRQQGQWSARCPSHDDKGPSLSVRETPDGAVLIHCFAGCTPAEVAAAMGLELADMFPPRDKSSCAPKKIANLLTAGQALELLASEVMFVAVALGNYFHGIALTEVDVERLTTAAGRIALMRDQIGRQNA